MGCKLVPLAQLARTGNKLLPLSAELPEDRLGLRSGMLLSKADPNLHRQNDVLEVDDRATLWAANIHTPPVVTRQQRRRCNAGAQTATDAMAARNGCNGQLKYQMA